MQTALSQITLIEILLLVLLTQRITSLLVDESGPFDIFGKFRDLLGVDVDAYSRCTAPVVWGMFCCFMCMSIWVAGAVCVVGYGWQGLWYALPISAGAIAVDRLNR